MLETAEFVPRSRKTLLCPLIYSSLLRTPDAPQTQLLLVPALGALKARERAVAGSGWASSIRPRVVAPLLGRGPASLRGGRGADPGAGLRAMLETAEFAPRGRKTLLCPPIFSSLLRTPDAPQTQLLLVPALGALKARERAVAGSGWASSIRPLVVARLLGRGPASRRGGRDADPGGGLRAVLQTAEFVP